VLDGTIVAGPVNEFGELKGLLVFKDGRTVVGEYSVLTGKLALVTFRVKGKRV
jgi:hypothetical protein